MRIRLNYHVALVLTVAVLIGFCVSDATGQKRRKRSTRSSKPAATSPTTDSTTASANADDPTIVSSADQTTATEGKAAKSRQKSAAPTPTPESEQDALRRSITELSGQVTKLTEKLNQMEEQQRSLVDIERLSRAEQRAETLRSQLRDVQAKEIDVQAQLDQFDLALQPENIERAVAVYGTTRPELAREQRRKQLESQRDKIRDQYNQLEQSRVKLEAAIATADTEVETLHQRLEASGQQPNPAAPAATATPPPVKEPYSPPNQEL